MENNLLGGNEETQTKFVQEHGKNIAFCADNPGSASCQKGLAMNDALMVALPTGLGGGLLAAATPEIAAAAKAAIQACAGNVVLCLNNAGIQMSEAIVPGGVGAGGAVGIGKTAAEATAAKAEAVAANAVNNSGKGNVNIIESIPNIKGTQVGLRNPAQIDSMKDDMINKVYDFTLPQNRIAGYVDSKGAFYVTEGHHRMAAAQELYKNTGDASYINNLIKMVAGRKLINRYLMQDHCL